MALEIVAVASSTSSTSPQCLDFLVDRPSKYYKRSVIAIAKAQRWNRLWLLAHYFGLAVELIYRASDPVNELIYDKLDTFDSSATDHPDHSGSYRESPQEVWRGPRVQTCCWHDKRASLCQPSRREIIQSCIFALTAAPILVFLLIVVIVGRSDETVIKVVTLYWVQFHQRDGWWTIKASSTSPSSLSSSSYQSPFFKHELGH